MTQGCSSNQSDFKLEDWLTASVATLVMAFRREIEDVTAAHAFDDCCPPHKQSGAANLLGPPGAFH